MVKDVRSTGKLYVKFANTDSQANAQKLVISGFVNDGKLSSTELNPDLEAPVLSENEEAKTATSITVQWDAVENTDSYQVLVDECQAMTFRLISCRASWQAARASRMLVWNTLLRIRTAYAQ